MLSQSMFLAVMAIYGSISLLPRLMKDYARADRLRDRLQSRQFLKAEDTYDFIIVGGGTSGAVLAHRLSEKYRVLVLEAGGEPFPLSAVPAMGPLLLNSPAYDWAFRTVPQTKSCLSHRNQENLWPRGRGLGGTTNINSMVYIRGHALDFDNWARLTGDSRWNFTNILPYSKKYENFKVPKGAGMDSFSDAYQGTNGEVKIERISYRPLAPYFLAAAKELGYAEKNLFEPYSSGGFSDFYTTSRMGRRWGTYQAFLKDIRGKRKDRLVISKYSLATQILFKGQSNSAYAVEYERHGKKRRARATKEVILSAGTIGSPKLLMLSGVGPKDHLESLGIQSVLDLPVGQNLQDHLAALVGPFTLNRSLTYILDRDTGPANLLNFLRTGTGPLSSSGPEALGFIQTGSGPAWPDVELILAGLSLHREGPQLLADLYNLKEDLAEEYYRPVAGKDSFNILSIINRPKSRGSIRLASRDPMAPPLIDPNYLDHPDDARVIVAGIRRALELVERTEAFRGIGAELSPTVFPACRAEAYRSDAYWTCFLRHFSLSAYHPSSACGMGKAGDPAAVVDSRLRVHGTRNLRVIDASVQPRIISSNIQSVCLMLGEIGATFIKEAWAQS